MREQVIRSQKGKFIKTKKPLHFDEAAFSFGRPKDAIIELYPQGFSGVVAAYGVGFEICLLKVSAPAGRSAAGHHQYVDPNDFLPVLIAFTAEIMLANLLS